MKAEQRRDTGPAVAAAVAAAAFACLTPLSGKCGLRTGANQQFAATAMPLLLSVISRGRN